MRITRQRRLERERAEQADQLDRIFEGMTDALLIYDANGRTIRTNPAAQRLLGLDAAPPDYAQLTVSERLARYTPRDAQGRLVTPEESARLDTFLTGTAPPEQVLNDVFWSLLNAKEFVFNH